ncbi:nucleotide exchange factor GrpE [Bacillus sp. sid0103]|uniref:nucleotide exchange factor GrpE n=1 Tax=Bacillus sp. sid0103 TaxID=2856337 RepID=UPI001C49130F|nr:nucleotide exchange factor GrpE [Bacillus sp. sid0103]MBV7508402.1 nucleotide exchange factor GrpE [Bacillus sp. sid0103]
MTTESTYIQEFRKMLQEIKPITRMDSEPEKIGKDRQQKVNELIHLTIQAVDAMDLILQSALKMNLKEWGEQIEVIINDYLKILELQGIEEIKSLGQFINGDTMTSIGTIPESFQAELQKFQVFGVHERGFRDKHTGKLIREAKVITIY